MASPTEGEGRGVAGPRLAYVMSRFPKLTETFVLFEVLAVERAGGSVELYPLLREREPTMHPEAAPLVERAHYQPFLSLPILRSQLWYLRHRRWAYLATLATVLRGTIRSPNFFLGALGIYPKTAHAARLMSAAGVEHVHCHFANHPALAGYVIHRLAGIPYSFTAHGSDLHVDRTFLWPKVREAAFVVAISEDNRREILAECPPGAADGKVVVLHCGVDTGRFRPREATAEPPVGAGTPPRPLRILSVGSLHEVKGQRVLIDACRRLAAGGVELRCTLVGDGPDRRLLERAIDAAGLGGTVELAGRRTQAEIADLMAGADVFVAPSVPTRSGKREGIPVVLMEAMASGVPVVASRLSGIPELVIDGECGLLVPPGDVPALAAAIERLAGDLPFRRRLGAAGRARVEASFDQDRGAAALLDLVARSQARVPAGSSAPSREGAAT